MNSLVLYLSSRLFPDANNRRMTTRLPARARGVQRGRGNLLEA
ncbi:MAG: hypothetical protein ACE5NA_07980 [Nitrospiraceae bacterium]